MHADFSVELGRDDPALELPWSSEDSRVRYYDLRKNPEAVAQIPEAVGHPELSAFLVRLNAADSRFETAKCDVWQSSEISPEEEIFGAERKFVSYVDILFVDENERNSFAWHEKFAEELCKFLKHTPDIAATVEVFIRRCYYHQRNDRQKDLRRGCDAQQAADVSANPANVSDGMEDASRGPTSFGASGTSDVLQSETESDSFPKKVVRGVVARLSDAAAFSNIGKTPVRSNEETVSDDTSESRDDSFTNGFYMTAYTTGFGNNDDESRHMWVIAIALLQYALIQFSADKD